MGSDLAIIVPVWGRPYHIEPLLTSIYNATPDAKVLFVLSDNEKTNVKSVIEDAREEFITIESKVVRWRKGSRSMSANFADYPRKINAGFRHTKEGLVFLGATDLFFDPRWFDNAVKYIDDKIQVIGTNDLTNPRVLAGTHATHSLITREYGNLGTFDNPDQVLHEGYWHEYVDDEFCATAQARGSIHYAEDSIVEHIHPLNKKRGVKSDFVYKQVGDRMKQGQKVWKIRNGRTKSLSYRRCGIHRFPRV